MTKYVFTINKMYNSEQIHRVRWWNKLFGFPGQFVIADYETDEEDHFRAAVLYFRRQGYEAQVMNMKLYKDII